MMKVFLVDDEIAIRENLRNSFPWEEKGYQLVGEAPDGEMALPMLRDLNADILLTAASSPLMQNLKKAFPSGNFTCSRETSGPDDAVLFMANNVNRDDAEAFRTVVNDSLKQIVQEELERIKNDPVLCKLLPDNETV